MSVAAALETLCADLGLKGPEIHSSSAFTQGDGWLGSPQRVKILHEHGALELLVKTAPAHPHFRRQIRAVELYENEARFYKNAALHLDAKLFPKFYTSSHQPPHEMLALEDLTTAGFRMLNSKETANLLTPLLVLYAKFHARSFYLKTKNPELFTDITANLFENLDGFYGMFAESIVDQCGRLERIFQSGSDATLLHKLREFRSEVVDVMTSTQRYIDANSVIIHGDAWINNIMSDKQKNNFRLIDFQLTRLGSVVQDLSYLFYTCCDVQQLRNLDQYLLLYHNALAFELERCGCDSERVYPFRNLKEDWRRFCKYGLAMTVVVLHGTLSRPEEFPDLRQVLETGGNVFVALNFDSVNEAAYNARIRAIFEHFITNEFL